MWKDVLYYFSFSSPHFCIIMGLLQTEFSRTSYFIVEIVFNAHITHRLKIRESLSLYIHCVIAKMHFQSTSPYCISQRIDFFILLYTIIATDYFFVQASIWREKSQNPIGGNIPPPLFLKSDWNIYTSLFWTDRIPIASTVNSYLIFHNYPVKQILSLGLP